MNPTFVIARKRDGEELTDQEIQAFIGGFASDEIPAYQMSALAMAIYLRGMTPAETTVLTQAMLDSGVQLEFPDTAPLTVDKHSTGGIGDKVSLVLAPLLACCDLWVPMISGRGLGATGGTLDKLESIPGFRTDLSLEEMHTILEQVGCVINGATAELAPADKKLYALRDVTATVASIPLITASIMSKKLAEGLRALVLDVKCGSGAFMKTRDQARQLAESLVAVGRRMGVATCALITDMNQPLGRMVGNTVEVNESLAALAGEAEAAADLMQVTLALGGEALRLTGRSENRKSGIEILKNHIASGAALAKFREMITAQTGDLHAPRPLAPKSLVESSDNGFVVAIDTEQLGRAVITMGGGRQIMTDQIDPSVGLEMLVRIGDRISAGQPLMRLFAHESQRTEMTETLRTAVTVGDQPVEPPILIAETIC
ncbi:MAG: thymidine phosphorylase [Gammaproteobacteria bacterium]|nr:thymidine phosphorylase [Gammaproteobacteria bacterium]